jgi:hypothetical protein
VELCTAGNRPSKVLCKWGRVEGTFPGRSQENRKRTLAIIFSPSSGAVIFERTCQYNLISDTHKYSALERKHRTKTFALPHSVCPCPARSHYFLPRRPQVGHSLGTSLIYFCTRRSAPRKMTPWILPRDFWTLFVALSQSFNRQGAP